MSGSPTVIRLLQARLERALRRRRENPSRADILVIPALALALDACGGGGVEDPRLRLRLRHHRRLHHHRHPLRSITASDTGSVDENDAGATITAVATENATEVTVDNDHFEVADGNLKLKEGSSLDFEAVDGGEVEVTITASGDGDSATHTVTVTVNDINEAPDAPMVVGGADGLNVDENDAGETITSFEAPSDPDAGDTVTLSVDDERFEINDARILKLKDGVMLDHEAEDMVTLVVTATDAAGLTSSTTLTVMVQRHERACPRDRRDRQHHHRGGRED